MLLVCFMPDLFGVKLLSRKLLFYRKPRRSGPSEQLGFFNRTVVMLKYTFLILLAFTLISACSNNKSENPTGDSTAPSTPVLSGSENTTESSITLTWSESTDNVELRGYHIYRDGSLTAMGEEQIEITFTDTNLSQGESHSYTIKAFDTSGNSSLASNSQTFTTKDIVNPTTPENLREDTVSSNSAFLIWDASSDNANLAGYRVYRDNQTAPITEVSTNSYLDETLSPSNNYTYTVTAFDSSDNESTHSTSLVITTTDSSITSKAFPSQINLVWQDPNNTDGSVIYNVYRDNEKIATTQQLSYQDRLLSPDTAYEYAIQIDESGVETLLPSGTSIAKTTIRQHTIQVYETAGINVTNHPVSVFIPLPYGVYTQEESELADTFIIRDTQNQIIPAQFWVRSRWHGRDNSIKELVAVFKVNASASSIVNYFFAEKKETSVDLTNPVTVEETSDEITISNQNITFTLNKNAFNLIDEISYKGQLIINNNDTDGAYLTNRFGETYLDSEDCTTDNGTQNSLTPLVFEIEESGPLRARIRVERPAYTVKNSDDPCFALFNETKEPVPGFVVWFDLYRDLDKISINYNTLNNPITSYHNGVLGSALHGWPLFFEETGIRFTTVLDSPTAEVSADQTALAYTDKVIQDGERSLTMGGSIIGAQGGAIKIKNSNGLGFALLDPYFHKNYPSGWDFDSTSKRLTFMTSPDGCATCEGFSTETIPSNSGMYALNDLSTKDKRFTLHFFDADSDISMSDELTRHRLPPNAVLSVNDYSSLGTSTDIFGISQPLTELPNTLDNEFADDKYRSHQQVFGIDFTRYRPCATGGYPYTATDIMINRPPSINQLAIDIYDDIKRPQLLPRYWANGNSTRYNALKESPNLESSLPESEGHLATEFSSSPYCSRYPARAFFGNGISKYTAVKTLPVEYSEPMTAGPRDNPHLWMMRLADAPIDNPMLEYFKLNYEQHLIGYAMQLENRYISNVNNYDSVGDEWPTDQIRGIGLSLGTLADSYMESGNEDSLIAIEAIMDVILNKQMDNGGVDNKQNEFSFQDGYMMLAVLNAMQMVDSSHNIYEKGWSYFFAGGTRSGLSGILDALLSVNFGYYATIGCNTDTTNPCNVNASGTNVSNIDPAVIAAYLLATTPDPFDQSIDRAKAQQVISHLVKYLDEEFERGPFALSENWRTDPWEGSIIGRTQNMIHILNTLPPRRWGEAISHKEGLPLHQ